MAFQSDADNLVEGDTNGDDDIFVRDRQSGTTEIASVDSSGNQANNDSYDPSVSSDGSLVAFDSLADNLVSDDTNGAVDIFVHEQQPSDTTKPAITLTTPVDGAFYKLNSTVNADYECADGQGGSGLKLCVGTVKDGEPINTSSTGTKTFTVTAEDRAGNKHSVTHTYSVTQSGTPQNSSVVDDTPAAEHKPPTPEPPGGLDPSLPNVAR